MTESTILDVGGMTCEGCSNNVKKALEGISGVDTAEVNHLSGIANVEHENVSREGF